jgi:hypothetical protein
MLKATIRSSILAMAAAGAVWAAPQLGSPKTGDQNQNSAQLQNQGQYGQQPQPTAGSGMPNEVVASEINVSGTVKDISSTRRMIKIQTPEGNTIKLKASPDVARLDQIKKGDRVDVRYLEPVALSLAPANKPSNTPVSKSVDVAPLQGTAPGTVAVNTESIVASVEDIDRQNRTVTLKDSDGTLLTIKAAPEMAEFDQLKVGDKIAAQYTQAIAFQVSRA